MLDFIRAFFNAIPELVWLLLIAYILLRVAHYVWLHFVKQNFKAGIKWVLLEVVPPREVTRSPKAMELFLVNGLYHWSLKGGLEKYWVGAFRLFFSLEIASIDGQVHFYIRIPSRLRELVETQMYAQYPQAQIREVDDYTLAVPEIVPDGPWQLWGCEFDLEKPEAYPLKTYVDFGLDKDPKEELKIDPLSPVIELFGSLKDGEQMWMQLVIRPSDKKFKLRGKKGRHDWVTAVEYEIDKLTEPYRKDSLKEDGSPFVELRPPPTVDAKMKAMMNKKTKLGFDTGIRVCYVAKKEAWDMNHRRDIRLIFRQYANPELNSLHRMNSTQADALGGGGFIGSFFMLSSKTVTRLSNRMLGQYRDRSFYEGSLREELLAHLPWPISPNIFPKYFQSSTFVLNVEELATLWHFPGQILKVPTLERIESKEAAPPTNLPM